MFLLVLLALTKDVTVAANEKDSRTMYTFRHFFKVGFNIDRAFKKRTI
jgi:hypothetical protein